MIWKIWKKSKLNSENIWKIWKKGKLFYSTAYLDKFLSNFLKNTLKKLSKYKILIGPLNG
jgi:hypothetical protein